MRAKITVVIVFFITLGYAYFRYIFYGPYRFPYDFFHILNKTFAFGSVLLLFLIVRSNKNLERKLWGKTVFLFVSMHVFCSIALFFQGYFEKNWQENPLLFIMNIAVGAIAYFFLFQIFRRIKTKSLLPGSYDYWSRTGKVILLILLHTLLWGVKSWFHPEQWYGSLIPITLLSFVTLMGTLWVLKKRNPKKINQL